MLKQSEYQSVLGTRYASKEMSSLFSPKERYSTWRKLWVELAKGQKELGLSISNEQIASMENCVETIDFDKVAQIEKLKRHDVMAHIEAFAQQCPAARGIIHLGATSTFVTDNGDLIQMKRALLLLQNKFVTLLRQFTAFCSKYAATRAVGWTHFQPAQPVTVGKRAACWMQDFLFDFADLNQVIEQLQFLGVKGATGTQASFLELFDGNRDKVQKLEEKIAKTFGFKKSFSLSCQTYTRKQDMKVLAVLKGIATSAHKFGSDLRLLCHLDEISEQRLETQVGSSAMPHKKNPMRAERLCGIARYLISLEQNASYTHATQWLERSLDDSANRRLYLPEAFLAADSVLELATLLISSIQIDEKMIEKNLEKQSAFLQLEAILMRAVKAGKERGAVHEVLKRHAASGFLSLEKLAEDPSIGLSLDELTRCEKPSIGLCEEQVAAFLKEAADTLKLFDKMPSFTSHIEI